MNKFYLCVDLKTFYASVECVVRGLDPYKTDLVVADIKRSKGAICLAISPKMKQRGVKNRSRIWEIPKNIKPIIAKPRMKLYIKYSAWVYSIYLKYISKEDIHPYSIDEVFLDITSYLKLYKKTPIEFADMIIKDILNTTGITAVAGIGTNLYLAKIALDIKAKHEKNNIAFLNEELYQKEMAHHLPLTDFWQINHGIEARLHKLHLKDMSDIAACSPKKLYKEFGVNAEYLIDHAKGIEPTTIKDIKNYKPKSHSISNSQILYKDYSYKSARIVLIEMIDNLVLELCRKNYCTEHVSFYIGYSKDVIPSLKVSFKLEQATASFKIISKRMLEEYDYLVNEYTPIRKIGITFSGLNQKKYEQINFFTSVKEMEEENNLNLAILDIKDKYGKSALLRGTSYLSDATQRERNKLVGGHNAE